MSKKIITLIVKPWERAEKCPDNWKTKSELKKQKLMPHPRAIPRAYVDRKIGKTDKSYYLYDASKTVPYKENKHAREMRKTRRDRLSCPKCGEYLGRSYKSMMRMYGHCSNCEEKEREEWRAKYRAYEPGKIIIYDLETTGLYDGYDEILQFAACDGNGTVLMNEYFKPAHRAEWTEAEYVNGISPEMVKDKPGIENFIDSIQALFDKAELLVAYNNGFDNGFLEAAGIKLSNKKHFDVMREFAEIYGEWSNYYNDYKWQPLVECAYYYEFEFNVHDALEDVRATLHCFKSIIGNNT